MGKLIPHVQTSLYEHKKPGDVMKHDLFKKNGFPEIYPDLKKIY